MRKSLIFALMAAAVVVGQQAATKDGGKQGGGNKKKSDAKVLNRAEIDALLARPDQALIIDVRRPDEISSIGGFPVYLSIQIKDLEKSLAWIPKDRTLIALSNHASRGGQAADILAKAGFKVAGAAGAEDYEEQGGTLTKIVAPPPRDNAKQDTKK
jgi:rhodanese-related sulfurtransferase